MRRVPTISLLAAAAVGCVDFDYLQSGASDGGVTTTPDAGTPVEDAAVPPSPACTHFFCDDFNGPDFLAGWSSRTTGGRVELSEARSKSPPRALLGTLPRRPTDRLRATLGRTFDGPWRHIVIETDIFIERPSWQPGDINAAILTVELVSGNEAAAGQYVNLSESYSGISGLADSNAPQLPLDQWARLKLDLDPARQVVLSVNGNLLVTIPTKPLPAAGAAPNTRVSLGVNGYNVPAPAITVYYDDLTVDFP